MNLAVYGQVYLSNPKEIMESTVDDFFNEINEIAPPKPLKQKESVWQQCYDELTGYSYYWNTKTDEVTWNSPTDFKPVKPQKKEKTSSKKELYVPPRAAPLLPKVDDSRLKIYSIGENSKNTIDKPQGNLKTQKRTCSRNSDSEDEKIQLISSYGEDSASESDEPEKAKEKNDNEKFTDHTSDEDDDIDILTKIQKRAKELKELGGDIPPEVMNVVSQPPTENKVSSTLVKEKNKVVEEFSLVAGYSDSEEEQENDDKKTIFLAQEPPNVSHSTLFPITKPIDMKDFLQPIISNNTSNNVFDSKVFQRKKRIGVALVNTVKENESDDLDSERKGFGFNIKDAVKDNTCADFKRNKVMFVKSDTLNPTVLKVEEVGTGEEKKNNDDDVTKKKDLENMYATVQEKLKFLSEGRPTILPVQVMVIQAETLFIAMKEGGLKLCYLWKWLEDTCSELIKLEKEAAPEGWLLQWDRSHKRYYYQNQMTGEGQWEYPQSDVNRYDDAMDISTTPPPMEPSIHMSPPLPPVIRSPTPPPPPIISVNNELPVPAPLPNVPPLSNSIPTSKFTENEEPLPPGVDLPEILSYQAEEKEPKAADPFYSALDSFYSDLAAIETTNINSSPPASMTPEESRPMEETAVELAKKRKKTKVKLAPGLSMKKKGVSQLVEKWKSVQQHYND